jgi:hypothetical protein
MNDSIAKRKLRNKMSGKASVKDDDEQRKIAEEHLENIVGRLCTELGLHIADWDLDKTLFEAVIKSAKSNATIQSLCDTYDSSYRLAKKLGLKISPKYRWFTNINQINLINQTQLE